MELKLSLPYSRVFFEVRVKKTRKHDAGDYCKAREESEYLLQRARQQLPPGPEIYSHW